MFRVMAFLMVAGLFVDAYGWRPLLTIAITAIALEIAAYLTLYGGKQ